MYYIIEAGFATGFATDFGTGLQIDLITNLIIGLRAGFAGLAILKFLVLIGWLVRVAVDQRVSTTATPVSIYKLLN